MTLRLLLDEHYAAEIVELLSGHDVVAVVTDPELRAQPDAELFRWAAEHERRIVTENIKDFRPLLAQAHASGDPSAQLLLVHPRRFPRGTGRSAQASAKALAEWLNRPDADSRPDEDWLM